MQRSRATACSWPPQRGSAHPGRPFQGRWKEASCLSRTGSRRRPCSRRCSNATNIIFCMKRSLGSLIALTLGCTVAATIFGFGSEVFSLRSVYKGLGREELIQATRLFVYIALGVLLAFRGGWAWGLGAIFIATAGPTAGGGGFFFP